MNRPPRLRRPRDPGMKYLDGCIVLVVIYLFWLGLLAPKPA